MLLHVPLPYSGILPMRYREVGDLPKVPYLVGEGDSSPVRLPQNPLSPLSRHTLSTYRTDIEKLTSPFEAQGEEGCPLPAVMPPRPFQGALWRSPGVPCSLILDHCPRPHGPRSYCTCWTLLKACNITASL